MPLKAVIGPEKSSARRYEFPVAMGNIPNSSRINRLVKTQIVPRSPTKVNKPLA